MGSMASGVGAGNVSCAPQARRKRRKVKANSCGVISTALIVLNLR